MSGGRLPVFPEAERKIYSLIASHDGLKAKEIASFLGLERSEVNRFLYASPLMRELCCQDDSFRWHALIRQAAIHDGLYEFSGWYGTVREFRQAGEEDWLRDLQAGCRRIGRNLNDTRGLIHSFLDCRAVMNSLFEDLAGMIGSSVLDWELVFELRLNRSRMIRIYSDVLVIAPGFVFSLEFKMKRDPEPDEIIQAAKYVPYLEVIFGQCYNVIPALVLTAASELFDYQPIPGTDCLLPVVSGNMLFNVFDEYLGFLS